MPAAVWIVRVFELYVALGGLFAVLFVTRGISRIDAAAQESTVGFRLVIFPGTILLWPLLLQQWMRKSRAT